MRSGRLRKKQRTRLVSWGFGFWGFFGCCNEVGGGVGGADDADMAEIEQWQAEGKKCTKGPASAGMKWGF